MISLQRVFCSAVQQGIILKADDNINIVDVTHQFKLHPILLFTLQI